jgi:hypothetical protein
MAGKVLNIKVCSLLKLRSSLTGNYPRNLPLLIQFAVGNKLKKTEHETSNIIYCICRDIWKNILSG